MDLKNLQKELNKIDPNLFIDQDKKAIDISYENDIGRALIYDFSTQKYNEENCLKYIPDKLHTLNALLGAYYADKKEIPANSETNKADDIVQIKLIKDIKDHLALINEDHENGYLELITHLSDPLKIILNHDGYQSIIYNFETKNFIYDSLKYITKPEFYALQNGMNAYWKTRIELNIDTAINTNKNIDTAINTSKNPFKKYTDHLADVLKEKNDDYGDSFSKSVNKFGIIAAVVRLEDKFNRLDNLTANGGKEKVKDESLADTALDISGYGLLLYKYLKEHERTSK